MSTFPDVNDMRKLASDANSSAMGRVCAVFRQQIEEAARTGAMSVSIEIDGSSFPHALRERVIELLKKSGFKAAVKDPSSCDMRGGMADSREYFVVSW